MQRKNLWKGCAAGLAPLLLATAAQAQSQVQVYGMVDAGVEHLNRVAGGGSLTRMPTVTAGVMPSRLGFRGTETLGNGLKAVFTLEMGMALDTGAMQQSGRGFGRQAYVGLAGDWGSLTLGRQYTMGLYAMMGSDLMGPAVFGLGSLNAYIPNQRLDNAVAYRGKFGNWELGAGVLCRARLPGAVQLRGRKRQQQLRCLLGHGQVRHPHLGCDAGARPPQGRSGLVLLWSAGRPDHR